MSISRWAILATLVTGLAAGSACTQKAADDTTSATDAAIDKTKEGSDKALDAAKEGVDDTKNIAEKTGDKTKEIAEATADKTKEVVSATGEKITDSWITTKLTAKFADETLLKGSNINVDSNDRVVTLKGTVGSDAAKARAAAIAGGTEGVTRVVNQIVVK